MDVTQEQELQRIANALKVVASVDRGREIGRGFLARLPVDSEEKQIKSLRGIARLVVNSYSAEEIRVLGAKLFAAITGSPDPFPGLSVGGRFEADGLDDSDRYWSSLDCVSDDRFEELLSEKPRTTVDSIFGAAMADRGMVGGMRRDRYGRIESYAPTPEQRKDYDDAMARVAERYRNAHKSPA